MKEMQFTIDINAPRERIWDILWQDKTFRQWASLIDPGTYMEGELQKGNEVQFISAEGYGVTSLVADVRNGEYLLLKHQADTKDNGKGQREKEWTGGEESYQLTENNGITTLTVIFDMPEQMENYFNENYLKAMQKIKELSE